MKVNVKDSYMLGAGAGAGGFTLDVDGPIPVMRYVLKRDWFDSYNQSTVPVGTEVVAPLLVIDINAVHGIVEIPDYDPGRTQRQRLVDRVWVYCIHDMSTLAIDNQALFYRRQDLERAINAEPALGTGVFDPMSYSTGQIAILRHPLAKIDRHILTAAQSAFQRTRGSTAHLQAGRMGSIPVAEFVRHDGPITIRPVVADPIEWTCALRRVWTTMMWLPRAAGKRLVDLNTTGAVPIDSALLPHGIRQNLCLEGSVVQSAAAWSVRRDRRTIALFGRAGAANLPLDLPLMLWTPQTLRENFVRGDAPIISVPSFDHIPDGISRVGAVCLGIGGLPVWMPAPGTAIPAALLTDVHLGLPSTFQMPVQFRVGSSEEWMPIASREDLYDKFVGLASAGETVVLKFRGGLEVPLLYSLCPPGYGYSVDPRTTPLINLPPLSAPKAGGATIGVPIALIASTLAYDPTPMHGRIMQGKCPDTDLYGRSLRTTDAAELGRLSGLRPATLPYTAQGADPQEWDPREQNPRFALPYVHSQHSPKLLADIRAVF